MAAASGSQSFTNDAGQGRCVIANLELKKGKIPKLTSDRIYSQTMLFRLNFWKDYRIKTYGTSFPLNNEHIGLTLLPPEISISYLEYAFVHIGFVQVSIKALARLGPNASVTITLRDGRHADLKESILVAFKSSLSMESPINFNLYPDISYFIPALTSSEALVLTIQPRGFDMKENSKYLIVSFSMCHKIMKTTLDPRPLIKGPRLEINTQKSHALVPIDYGDQVVLQDLND